MEKFDRAVIHFGGIFVELFQKNGAGLDHFYVDKAEWNKKKDKGSKRHPVIKLYAVDRAFGRNFKTFEESTTKL